MCRTRLRIFFKAASTGMGPLVPAFPELQFLKHRLAFRTVRPFILWAPFLICLLRPSDGFVPFEKHQHAKGLAAAVRAVSWTLVVYLPQMCGFGHVESAVRESSNWNLGTHLTLKMHWLSELLPGLWWFCASGRLSSPAFTIRDLQQIRTAWFAEKQTFFSFPS